MSSATTIHPKEEKLSLLSAILINLNIMLGAGLFINTVVLTKTAGSLGASIYIIGGLLILPLILTFSKLFEYLPSATFYDIGEQLGTVYGFLNSWTYFIGKLATASLGIHIFITLMQRLIPQIAPFNPLILDSCMVVLFVLLNMLNIRTGKTINYLFITLKFIPIAFVICTAIVLFNTAHFTEESLIISGIPSCIPFVLFAFAGFEASCSISKSLKNPHKNGPRAILISYALALTTVTAYQLSFFGVLGSYLGTLESFRVAIPEFIGLLIPVDMTMHFFIKMLILIGIAVSSLGASYGVIYTNIWNLNILAEKKHTFWPHFLTQKNRYGTPFVCVLLTGLVILCYVWSFWGRQIPLQQIAATAVTVTYFISVLTFLKISFARQKNRTISLLALLSCCVLFGSTISNMITFGIHAILAYVIVIMLGLIMFYATTPRACPLKNS